jgi:hypothetical protein
VLQPRAPRAREITGSSTTRPLGTATSSIAWAELPLQVIVEMVGAEADRRVLD